MSNNFNNISINDNENFYPENHPNAISELSALSRGISDIPIYFRAEIIISYLKEHCLKTTWIDANPALSRRITSGFFKTSHLESLFESFRNNKFFIKNFEQYISKQLLTGRN